MPNRSDHTVRWPLLLATIFLIGSADLRAQTDIYQVSNDYVAAHVNAAQGAGRFWISAGPKKGWFQFLFHGNKSVQQITSNLVFRVDRGNGQPDYYTNATNDFFLRGQRPRIGADSAVFLPYKKITWSGDTIAIDYDLGIYDLQVRLIAEKTTTIYDNGADVLIEFEYHIKNFVSGGSIGVLLMLDGDNGAAVGSVGGAGDKTSILTTEGYFDTDKGGYVFPQVERPMPEFYHVGNFQYNSANIELNRILPIHRLKGFSNGGARLDEPDLFGVGNWNLYRTLGWNPGPHNRVGDVATALQWTKLSGHGTVRTAFGTNNEKRNNIYTCRDDRVFADIRTVREIKQISDDGPYDHEEFEVEMWVTNTGDYDLVNSTIRLYTPIETIPEGSERLLLDPATPKDQNVVMLPSFTRKLTWRLRLNPNSNDTLAQLRFLIKDRDDEEFRPFLDDCAPLITIKPFRPPPTDTLPPMIDRLGSGRAATAFWNYSTYDRHPGFDYDTGLEDIRILSNPGNNFRMIVNPIIYRRCDVNETVNLRFEVIDTVRTAEVVFAVRDCNGNIALDSVRYSPRPDPFKPQVIARDSSGSWDPVQYPCNARVRTVEILDSANQFADRGDYGLGSIEVLSISNFLTPTIINQRGEINGPVLDFDSRMMIRLEVQDSLTDASAEIRVSDYAGNDTILSFTYCTVHDFLPPKITRIGNSATRWEVTATDSASWDRGLLDATIVRSRNVRFVWPDGTRRDSLFAFSKGARASTVIVELVNRCDPGDLILEFRDLQSQTDPQKHVSYDTIRYAGIADTLAPNVRIAPGYDLTTYYFDVTIDDIHSPGGVFFECDRGLETISIFTTSNIRLRSPLVRPDRYNASVSFEVIDTLAIDQTDTICVTAVDSVGNRTTTCTYWPTDPDRNPPVFTGIYDRASGQIIGTATDARENDRGLAAVTVRDEVNVDPGFNQLSLGGEVSTQIAIPIPDPQSSFRGEIVLRDLYGELVNLPESSIHTVVIPFELPVVSLEIGMPSIVDSWTEFEVPVKTLEEINEKGVRAISFEIEARGPARFLYVQVAPGIRGAFTVTPGLANRLQVRFVPAVAEVIPAGMTIGTMRFEASTTSTNVVPFALRILPNSLVTNDGADTTITIREVAGDPLVSQLTLPSPLLKIAGDTLMYVNGECNRALTTAGAGKPNGLAILSVEPNILPERRETIEIVIRDLPATSDAILEWIAPNGSVVSTTLLRAEAHTDVARYRIPVPTTEAAGLYLLRIRTSDDNTSERVLIVR